MFENYINNSVLDYLLFLSFCHYITLSWKVIYNFIHNFLDVQEWWLQQFRTIGVLILLLFIILLPINVTAISNIFLKCQLIYFNPSIVYLAVFKFHFFIILSHIKFYFNKRNIFLKCQTNFFMYLLTNSFVQLAATDVCMIKLQSTMNIKTLAKKRQMTYL